MIMQKKKYWSSDHGSFVKLRKPRSSVVLELCFYLAELGAWRVRSSMNTLARELGITCTADIGLLSIEYTCIDGDNCYTESLCLFNTGVNTSKLYRGIVC